MNFKLLRKISICTLISTIPVSFLSLASCKKEINITRINLFAQHSTLRPGSSERIRAVALPTYETITNLKWEIIDVFDPKIKISNDGLVTVDKDIEIYDLMTITVKASCFDNPKVLNTIKLSILPKPTGDFLGFCNNEVQYIGRGSGDIGYEVCSAQINQTDEFTYKLSKPIDLFVNDDTSSHRPDYFTSAFYFKPIIDSTTLPYMSFKLIDTLSKEHSINWINYSDNNWTVSIPDVWVIDDKFCTETVVITFACDDRITLTIDFNIWLHQTSSTGIGLCSYTPLSKESQIHFVEEQAGQYSAYLKCPASETQGTYTGVINQLFFYGYAHEFIDFKFIDFAFEEGLDSDIKNALEININPINSKKREFDNSRIYWTSINYSFDLEKKKHDASYWDYEPIKLGTMDVQDALFENITMWIDFYIEWI